MADGQLEGICVQYYLRQRQLEEKFWKPLKFYRIFSAFATSISLLSMYVWSHACWSGCNAVILVFNYSR